VGSGTDQLPIGPRLDKQANTLYEQDLFAPFDVAWTSIFEPTEHHIANAIENIMRLDCEYGAMSQVLGDRRRER
jgi:hypothetical protein